MSDICKCKIKGRGAYPQCEHDARVNMKMTHVETKNGFFRICLECSLPLYLRNNKGPNE